MTTTAGDRGARPTSEAVIAHTTEDDRNPEVRRAALEHASSHGCLLILFAADVASTFSDPMPNQWGSEGEADRFGDHLSAKDLEFLGRHAIAGQVRDSRAAGVRATAWLPSEKGPKALADYAAAEGAHIVFVPESLDTIDELRPLLAVELRAVAAPSPEAKPAKAG